jgi:pyruvate dehydrogenase E1 component alpha subunit
MDPQPSSALLDAPIRLIEQSRTATKADALSVHLSIGQEAVAVGVAASLGSEDCVMSAHRAHAHYLAKGGDLRALLAELYGRASGCSSGRGGSMHLVDLDVNMLGSTPIVGSALPLAVGAAFGAWQQGRTAVTIGFLGEGPPSKGCSPGVSALPPGSSSDRIRVRGQPLLRLLPLAAASAEA